MSLRLASPALAIRASGLVIFALVLTTSCGGTAIRPKSDAATNPARADGAEETGGTTGTGGTGSGGTAGASADAAADAAGDAANDGKTDGPSADGVAADGGGDGAAGKPGDAAADGAAGNTGAGGASDSGAGAGGAGGGATAGAGGTAGGAGGAGGATAGAGGTPAGAGGTAGAGGATAGAGGTVGAGGAGGAAGAAAGGAAGAGAGGAGGATAGAGGAAGGTGAGGAAGDGGVTPAPDAIAMCGGVRCPALFTLLATCRPTGACVRESGLGNSLSCYGNGVRVRSQVNPGSGGEIMTVTKPDGVSPCYSMNVGLPAGNGLRPVTLRSPDGTVIAEGSADPADNGQITITCDGVSAELQDRTCLADPGVANCAAGSCP